MIGFCVLGTQVILIGAVPMDFGTRKAAGSAAGFIDFFGYIGAGMAGVFSGVLTDAWGWGAAFWFWIISAFLSSAICFGLWTYKPACRKIPLRPVASKKKVKGEKFSPFTFFGGVVK